MAKRLLLLIALLGLAGGGIAAPEVEASGGVGMAARDGVTVNGSPYRYVALFGGYPDKLTMVVRIDRQGGRAGRFWHMDGIYQVPAVASDGRGGGLSADGTTLVLSKFSRAYPPRVTKLAILDTDLSIRLPRTPGHPRSPRRSRHAISHVNLPGHFTLDAISPDGATIYLTRYTSRPSSRSYLTDYEIRAFDVERQRLLAEPIVDPEEPDERMGGLPITRADSPDGRWAYTLYDGNGKTPFVHALDTVRRTAVCVDLPQLEGRRNLFMLRLRTESGGRRLVVLDRPPTEGRLRPLLSVDTKTFAVSKPDAVATASSRGVLAWPPVGLAAGVGALALGLLWRFGGRRRESEDERPPRQI